MHEHDEEICIALSEGTLILGRSVLNGEDYELDAEGKVKVEWNTPVVVSPWQAFNLPEKEAHFAKALPDKPFYIMFILPKSHHEDYRKFVTPPQF